MLIFEARQEAPKFGILWQNMLKALAEIEGNSVSVFLVKVVSQSITSRMKEFAKVIIRET